MKVVAKVGIVGAMVAGLVILASPVFAFPEFFAEFEKTYPALKDKIAAAEGGKCNVCHEGKEKKMRNEYGKALDKLLSKDDKKDAAKIKTAFDDVAKQKPTGAEETFGDRVKDGRLPTEAKK